MLPAAMQQARYAAGVKEILRRSFAGEDLEPTDVIVQVGQAPRVGAVGMRAAQCM